MPSERQIVRWEMTTAYDQETKRDYLAMGWEPFAVTRVLGYPAEFHFRRPVYAAARAADAARVE